MSQRDISATIDDIYGFKFSSEQISKITDYVLEEQQSWQNWTLALFTIFGAFGSTGVRKFWGFGFKTARHIFDKLKSRGVQEVGFISMDEVSDSQLAKVCPYARLQGLCHSLEKNLRCTKPQSLPRGIRAVLPSLGKISRRDCWKVVSSKLCK